MTESLTWLMALPLPIAIGIAGLGLLALAISGRMTNGDPINLAGRMAIVVLGVLMIYCAILVRQMAAVPPSAAAPVSPTPRESARGAAGSQPRPVTDAGRSSGTAAGPSSREAQLPTSDRYYDLVLDSMKVRGQSSPAWDLWTFTVSVGDVETELVGSDLPQRAPVQRLDLTLLTGVGRNAPLDMEVSGSFLQVGIPGSERRRLAGATPTNVWIGDGPYAFIVPISSLRGLSADLYFSLREIP
jgi:hypothetical protein